RARLEAEAEDADLLAALLHHGANAALELLAVARQDRVEDGKVQVEQLRLVRERPDILRQAGSAESESRLEIVRRQVELRVLAEDLHELVAVEAQALADVADFVREADLERVPGVVRILHHLRGLVLGAKQRTRQVPA